MHALLRKPMFLTFILDQREDATAEEDIDAFCVLVTRVLGQCQRYVEARESNISTSHPLFGWLSNTVTSRSMLDVLPLVAAQLRSALLSCEYVFVRAFLIGPFLMHW